MYYNLLYRSFKDSHAGKIRGFDSTELHSQKKV